MLCVCLWVRAFNFLHSCLSVNNMADFQKKKKKAVYFMLTCCVWFVTCWTCGTSFFPCNSCPNLLPTSMLQALYIYASVYTCTCTDAFPIKVYLSFIQTQGIFVETKTTVLYAATLELRGKGGPVKDLSLLFSLSQPPGPKPEFIWHCWLAAYLELQQLMVKVTWRLLRQPPLYHSSCTGVEGLAVGQ